MVHTTRLRVGFVGSGFIARFQATAMRQVRGIELAGVYSPNRAAAFAAFAKDLGVGTPVCYGSVTELAKHVDCIAIFAPNFLHVPIMEEIAAAVAGGAELKGVICEKPLGRNVAEARRLVELAESAGLLILH